jgi:hypothetical protein
VRQKTAELNSKLQQRVQIVPSLMRIILVTAGVAVCACSRTPESATQKVGASTAVGDEDCAAGSDWFKSAETPEPDTTEPRAGEDCDFYQRAWQQFLRATDGTADSPRFLSFETYASLFGADRQLGLLPSQAPRVAADGKRPLVLAPRLVKSRQANDAEDILQAGSSAILVDQNGHAIYYSIFVNPAFVSFVRAKHYNNLNNLKGSPAEEEIPVGVVEYKSSWQIVDSANPPKDRVVVAALVPWLIPDPAANGKVKVDTTRPLRPVTVALIGLHVVFLPENHPEMVWATFEYDRNAPSLKGNPQSLSGIAVCTNSKEPRDETVADDGNAYVLYESGTLFKDANKKPTALTIVDGRAQTLSPRASIVRAFPFSGCSASAASNEVTEVDPAIVSLNGHVKGALASKRPWLASYSLIGAVWQDAPRSTDPNVQFKSDKTFEDEQIAGENRLSSTSMESFTQTSSPNCLACHDTHSKGGLDPKRISVSHLFRRFALGPH